jgi:hypothetical protein
LGLAVALGLAVVLGPAVALGLAVVLGPAAASGLTAVLGAAAVLDRTVREPGMGEPGDRKERASGAGKSSRREM